MSPKSALAAAALIVTLGCAAPAAADVAIYTFMGTISDGYDETGVFGTAGRDLAGLAFTATFRRDDAAIPHFGTDVYSEISGGPYGDLWRSPVLASLTIAGGDPMAFGQTYGRQIQFGDGWGESFMFEAATYGTTVGANDRLVENRSLNMGANSNYADYLPSIDYHTLPSLTVAATPDFSWFGGLQIDEYLYDLDTGDILSRNYANATFAPTSLTVTIPVPEPAAWALMLTGFFGAGAAIRSRRRAVAGAASRPADASRMH